MSENSLLKIALTGHRHLQMDDVLQYLNEVHAQYPEATWITGGAVGLDSLAAHYAILHKIPFWLVLPFPPAVMSKKWPAENREFLLQSIKYCEKLSVLSPTFNISIYQRRNERMVDWADLVAAFFDGSPSGTANCVRYADKVGKKVVRFLGS